MDPETGKYPFVECESPTFIMIDGNYLNKLGSSVIRCKIPANIFSLFNEQYFIVHVTTKSHGLASKNQNIL